MKNQITSETFAPSLAMKSKTYWIILLVVCGIQQVWPTGFCEKYWQDNEYVLACVGYVDVVQYNGTTENITELYLIKNNFTIIKPEMLERFATIRLLLITLNGVRHIEDGSFDKLADVNLVDLSFNNIKELPENLFQYNYNLEDISLRKNVIKKLKPNAFSKLLNLKEIDLSFNAIEHLPKNLFAYNVNLETINLRENQIAEVSEEMFTDLAKLRGIDLSYNDIQVLVPHVFRYNFRLQEVRLRGNQIKLLDYSVTHLNLKVFDLLKNPLLLEDEEVKETLAALHRSNVKTYVKLNEGRSEHRRRHNVEMPTYIKSILAVLSVVSVLLLLGIIGLIFLFYSKMQKKTVPQYFTNTGSGSQECLISDDNYLKLKIPNGVALYVKNVNGEDAAAALKEEDNDEISKVQSEMQT